MFDVIVCDPDESKYEGKFLGLFYTAVSRATTLGDDDGLNSALYFTGDHVKEDRIRSIGKKTHSQDNDYLNVRREETVNLGTAPEGSSPHVASDKNPESESFHVGRKRFHILQRALRPNK